MMKSLTLAAFALVLALLPGRTPATAQAQLTPVEVVRIIYEDWEYRPTYSAALQALFALDDARADRDGMGNLDFDWISGGQDDPDYANLEFTRVSEAAVRVTFTNYGDRAPACSSSPARAAPG